MIFLGDDGDRSRPPAPVEQCIVLDLAVGTREDLAGRRRLRLDLADDARSVLAQRSHERGAVGGAVGRFAPTIFAAREARALVRDDPLQDAAHAAARSFIRWKLSRAAPESMATRA